MRIAIIDADLIGRKKHRFPNLACEKIAGFWKERGADVELLTSYPSPLELAAKNQVYDKTYVSKVFTDTPIPDYISSQNVQIGGTGFYFDKAPELPFEIEHCKPDYHLYDDWIEDEVLKAKSSSGENFNEQRFRVQFKEYKDYSIGFLTRGCFRKCPFCVNQRFNKVVPHSPLEEFLESTRKKLCFLDDNFLGYPKWKELLESVLATNKPFKFKQGLDERLLTEEKAEMLFSANYDGDYTFAFDNIADYELIQSKLSIIKKYNTKRKCVKFYVLVGFESVDATDIKNVFRRIELLFNYGCIPYIMRYMSQDDAPWQRSKYRSLYVTLARWCNQPRFVKKTTFREFCEMNQQYADKIFSSRPPCEVDALASTDCSAMQSLKSFEKEFPEIARRYFDIRFSSCQ